MDHNTLAGLMVGAAAVQVAPDVAMFVRKVSAASAAASSRGGGNGDAPASRAALLAAFATGTCAAAALGVAWYRASETRREVAAVAKALAQAELDARPGAPGHPTPGVVGARDAEPASPEASPRRTLALIKVEKVGGVGV